MQYIGEIPFVRFLLNESIPAEKIFLTRKKTVTHTFILCAVGTQSMTYNIHSVEMIIQFYMIRKNSTKYIDKYILSSTIYYIS